MIGRDPERKNAERERGEKIPPEKGKVETEEPPFVPPHEIHGTLSRFIPRKIGTIVQNEPAHRIGVHLDDARDHEEQRPKEDEDIHEKEEDERIAEARKAFEELGKRCPLPSGNGKADHRKPEHERARKEQDGDRPDDDIGKRRTRRHDKGIDEEDEGEHPPPPLFLFPCRSAELLGSFHSLSSQAGGAAVRLLYDSTFGARCQDEGQKFL